MKLPLGQRGSTFVLAAFLASATQVFATPVDRSVGSCTFVDAVVSQGDTLATMPPDNTFDNTSNSAAVALENTREVVRVPVNTAGLGNCDVVQFSTETVGLERAGNHRGAIQKIMRMATVFENLHADSASVEQIFTFSLPAVGVASLDN